LCVAIQSTLFDFFSTQKTVTVPTRVVLGRYFMVFFTPVITRSQAFSAAATDGFYGLYIFQWTFDVTQVR